MFVERQQRISSTTIIDRLPSEMVALILSYLSISEMVHVSLVCRSLHELVSPSLIIDNNSDHVHEYSVDVWKEIINQFKRVQLRILSPNKPKHANAKYEQIVSFLMGITTKDLPSVVECKELFVKLLCKTRVCRSCGKESSTLEEVIEGSIISSCNCPGYVCAHPCLDIERVKNHSISKCSLCGYKYTIVNDQKEKENVLLTTKIISQYPVMSGIFITLISSFAVITLLYLIMAGVGYAIPGNSLSDVWVYLENISLFKNIPLWKHFTNGMSTLSIVFQIILFIYSVSTGSHVNVNYDDAMEILSLILTVVAIIGIPIIIQGTTDSHVTTVSVRHNPVKKRHTIQQEE